MVSIKQIIPEGYCLNCQGCCRFTDAESCWPPGILKEEQPILDLAAGKVALNKKADGFICCFFDDKANTCKVYLKRPFECRLYPFIINKQENRMFLAIDLSCGFAHENKDSSLMQEHIGYMKAVSKTVVFLDLINKNPQIAQEYPGASNIIELIP
jgi:Fe-S-cluster containining protein